MKWQRYQYIDNAQIDRQKCNDIALFHKKKKLEFEKCRSLFHFVFIVHIRITLYSNIYYGADLPAQSIS